MRPSIHFTTVFTTRLTGGRGVMIRLVTRRQGPRDLVPPSLPAARRREQSPPLCRPMPSDSQPPEMRVGHLWRVVHLSHQKWPTLMQVVIVRQCRPGSKNIKKTSHDNHETSKERDHHPLSPSTFKAHRLLYHSTLGLRVIKKKKKRSLLPHPPAREHLQGYLAHKKTPTP